MPLEVNLGNGLVFRTVRDERDVGRYVTFNATYNNIYEGLTCACLLRHHPETTLADYWLIEDEISGEIVSTICLIPWLCRYEGIDLRVAMLEMVLTHPAYRGRGLVRTQIKRFLEEVRARAFDLSIIWGIPYYYRQYGYGYSLDGNVYESLPIWRIPDAPIEDCSPYSLRPATVDNITRLADLYRQAVSALQVCVLRDAKYWDYLLRWAMFPVEILENEQSREIAGYSVMTRSPESKSIRVLESGIASAEAGLAFLRTLKAGVEGEILIAWPENGTLAQLARSLGSQAMPGGQWLLCIPNMTRFLGKIGSVLESRLAASTWRGLTTDLIINLFREAYKLRFVAGKLVAVEPLGFVDSSMGADGGHLCIPSEAFLRLVFGYRTLDELRDAWPDIVVKAESRSLVDILFPRMLSYLHTPFHYMGPVS